ncbi:phage portal protein [Alkalihalobacillus sp. NPDC078783]
MGLFDRFKKNSELEFMLDLDLIDDFSNKTHLKRMAIETCIGFIARTISQSEFRIRDNKSKIKEPDEMYYRFNLRPNLNQTATRFWQKVIRKLIFENEVLIIQSDTKDLLIADSFIRKKYAVHEDTFSSVVTREFEWQRTFPSSEVIYLEYSNEKLSKLIDELFSDYGDLFGRLLEFQKRKNQIRATIDTSTINGTDEDKQKRVTNFISKTYGAVRDKSVALIPQQKGFEYKEHQKDTNAGPSVDEINKITDGFMFQVANAMGIPIALLKGDMADLEKPTRNFMVYCIKPLIKNIADELNYKWIEKRDYLNGKKIEIRPISYNDIFDLATAIDKLTASSGFSPNDIREELGKERVDDPEMDKYIRTKNYETIGSDSSKGGENEND